MLTLPLEPTDDRANPAFKNASSCAKWLAQLQLTNLHQAHGVLRLQLDEFNSYPMRGLERFYTLELLRETVSSIQADYAKKLIAKKLPFSYDELTIFVAIVGLWQGMIVGYRRCLQACMAGDTQLAVYGALLCQRCLLYSGLQIFEYMRNGYEFDTKLWRQLHELYAFSEEQMWHLNKVGDGLNGNSLTTSCSSTYVKTLLACHAHRADLSRRQQQMLDRWLTQWSSRVTIELKHESHIDYAPPLAVDLGSALGLQLPQLVTPSKRMRYLVMIALSKLIRINTVLLQQGKTPQQLELGESYNSAECVSFLNYLHQCWCEGRDGRVDERRSTRVDAQVCYGMESCYAYIANKPFKQPHNESVVDTLTRKQIAIFGHAISDAEQDDLLVKGLVLEIWMIENESIRGARMLRKENVGVRLGLGQLVAVRPTNASAFMVGTASWIKVTLTGQLHIGLRYMPGLPKAVAMKAVGINQIGTEKYVAALLLPAVPALKTPASLVAPREWFSPGRVVEIVMNSQNKFFLQMELSIEKGMDYERISFTEMQIE